MGGGINAAFRFASLRPVAPFVRYVLSRDFIHARARVFISISSDYFNQVINVCSVSLRLGLVIQICEFISSPFSLCV